MKINHYSFFGIFLSMLFFSSIAMATGPRVTQGMLDVSENEIFAVDAPPFASLDLPENGLNAAIVKIALAAVDVKTTVTVLPVAKMVEYYLYEEKALAAFTEYVNFTGVDEKSFIFVPIFCAQKNYFYLKSKHPSGLNWKDSSKASSKYIYGTYAGDNIASYKEAGIETKFFRHRDVLKNLIAGEVDFIRMTELEIDWMLNKDFAKHKTEVTSLDTEMELMPLFVVFNKKHADSGKIAKKLKQGLIAILDNGQYADILKKYLVDEEEVIVRINALRQLIPR